MTSIIKCGMKLLICSQFNCCVIEVQEWMSNSIPHFAGHVGIEVDPYEWKGIKFGPEVEIIELDSITFPSDLGSVLDFPPNFKCIFSSRHPFSLYHDDVIKWKHFGVTVPLCGEFIGHGEFPSQRPVTRSFDVFFDQCLYKRLSKQSRHRRF